MAGFIWNLMTCGLGDSFSLFSVVLSIFACCALCGMYKTCKACRVRDCLCCRWCLRRCCDDFDDFDLIVFVQQATFSSSTKRRVKVRISADRHVVETNVSDKGVFNMALQLQVNQGVRNVLIEMIEGKSTVLASYKLSAKAASKLTKPTEAEYSLQTKAKGIATPKVKLTMQIHDVDEECKSLLYDVPVSKATVMLLNRQLEKDGVAHVKSASAHASQLELLAKAVKGKLDVFGAFGSENVQFAGIKGPPSRKRYFLMFYSDEKSFDADVSPRCEVDLLKIVSVQADPERDDIFHIIHVDSNRLRQRLQLQRLDLPTEAWVESLVEIIKLLRLEKEKAAK